MKMYSAQTYAPNERLIQAMKKHLITNTVHYMSRGIGLISIIPSRVIIRRVYGDLYFELSHYIGWEINTVLDAARWPNIYCNDGSMVYRHPYLNIDAPEFDRIVAYITHRRESRNVRRDENR